jgi:hypothetical protein
VPRRARRTLLLLPAAAPARRSSPRSGPGRSSLRTAAAPPTAGAGRSASGRTARGRSRPAGCSSTGFPPCRPVGRSDGWIPRATAKEYGERRRKNKKQARSSGYLSRRITRLWQRRRGGDQRCVCGEARATKLPRPPPCEASTTTARGETRRGEASSLLPPAGSVWICREGRGRGEQDRRSRVAGAAELVSLADLQRVAETFLCVHGRHHGQLSRGVNIRRVSWWDHHTCRRGQV